jgi:CSLREA domain-containing protein
MTFKSIPATCLMAILLATPLPAVTIVVNTTSDSASDNCSGGACSLRAAMLAANATPAADLIEFNIPLSDPGFQPATAHWLISIADGPLLPSTGPSVVIDGTSQPGAFANSNSPDQGGLNGTLKIEVRGSNPIGNANYAFQLDSDSPSVLRGLAISGYREGQVYLRGAGVHRIEGCYLGTDISGSEATLLSGSLPIGNGVVLAGNGEYVIGGTTPASRNLLSGLNLAISTSGSALPAPRIQGNLIGTNAAGNAVIGNTFGMLAFRLGNALIGGTSTAARNVFSGHTGAALLLRANLPGIFADTRVHGNYFGTDVSGILGLGNDYQGGGTSIEISGAGCALSFGGTAAGETNLVAYSRSAGVAVFGCNGLASALNHYRANQGLPFDNAQGNLLGATANDVDDADEGANRLQNFPEIILPPGSLPAGGSSLTLQYLVDSAPANASYPITVNFHRGDCGGGARQWVGSDMIGAAEAQMLQTFVLTSVDGGNVLPLLASAVDAAGNTSEFAPMQGDPIFHDELESTPTPLTPGSCR